MSTSQKWKLFENGRLPAEAGSIRQGTVAIVKKKHQLVLTRPSAENGLNTNSASTKRFTHREVHGAGTTLHGVHIPVGRNVVKRAEAKQENRNRFDKTKHELDPILLTVAQAAVLMGITQGAVRHMIFNVEAYRSNPSLSKHQGFLDCIVRPPGVGRVFIHRAKLLNLIASWMDKGGAA